MADDDHGVRASLVANLEVEGYDIKEAADGGQALELIESEPFDLVISDVVMPVATGLDVVQGLKRRSVATPIILVSAFVHEDMIARAMSEGLYAMLYKPFAMERILRIVARALDRHALLLVDDSPGYLASLAASLRAVGVPVQAVENGEQALEFAHEHSVDLCVLDLVMSPTDGVRTCAALREIDAGMDIVAITGASDPELVRKISRYGVSACLRKPFEVGDLLTAIARVRSGQARKK